MLVVFNKPVTGFEAGDLTVTNGTATRVRLQSTSPSVQRYSVNIDVTGANSDVLTVSVPADVVNERNKPSSDFADTCCQQVAAEIRFDEIETVISSTAKGPVNGAFDVHIDFARDVPDMYDIPGSGETVPRGYFNDSDIAVTNGSSAYPASPVIIAGGKERFRVRVTPRGRFEGVLTVSVPAASVWTGDGGVNGAAVFEIKVDTWAPDVTGIEITSDPGEDETYAGLEEIEATVTFREDVTVESGSPSLGLMVGGADRAAAYREGSGTAQLVFVYEVADGDSDDDGVSVEAGRLAGGVVEDAGGNRPPAHGAWGPFAGHEVDGVKPKLSALKVADAKLTLTYDEALDGSSTPAPGAFTVNVGDGVRAVTGVAVSDSVVTLTLASAVSAFDAVTVTYTPGADPVQDLVGNDAAALVDETVQVAEPTSPIIFTFDWYTGEPFEVVVAFRKNHIHGSPVTDFDVDDITVTNGTVMDDLADDNGNGIVWRATVTPTDSTQPVVVSVAAGAATVTADGSLTKAGGALTLLSYANGPVAGMAIMQDEGVYRADMLFRGTDIITGLECPEVELSGATKDPIHHDARYCAFWILPSGGGNITITIAAGAYTNVDGSASTDFTHTIQVTAGARANFGSSHSVGFIKVIPASAPTAATPGMAIELSPSGSVPEAPKSRSPCPSPTWNPTRTPPTPTTSSGPT